jgi:peroxiredoxin
MIKRAVRFGRLAMLLAMCVAAASVLADARKFPDEGVWRGEFTVDGEAIPFNFEITGKDAGEARFSLINGTRRDHFVVERISDDELSVPMNTYDAALVFKVLDGKRIQGEYRDLVPRRKGARNLPFIAEHGKSWRFVEPQRQVAADVDLNGKWALIQADDVQLRDDNSNERNNRRNQVGLFKQNGTHLSGVIMTSVGDSRELEGIVQGNRFYLSHFSGPSPRLIKGTVDEDGRLQGSSGSGIYNVARFEGVRDDDAQLADPYKLTRLKEGQTRIDFTFPDLNGRPVSLSDEKYRGKVVIVEIIGTWCPNCTDQTYFLAPWFKQNRHRGVEAIAIAFEQEDSFEYFKKTLGKFKSYFDIQYDIVFGGIADKKVATEKLQGLNYMAAFPTTLLIDRRGEVREIYTGYTGEVTGQYFQDYVAKFNRVLDELIAEPDPYANVSQTGP